MAASSSKQTGIKVVLGLIALAGLIFGIMGLLFTRSMMESFGGDDPFNKTVDALGKGLGMMFLTWGIAAIIALRNTTNRALLQTIIVGWGLLALGGVYSDAVVLKAGATSVVIDVVFLALAVALIALYPRGQQAT